MNKKSLAGIAFMAASQVAFAKTGVALQALQLLQENRISYEEFVQLTGTRSDSGSWSNSSITAGTWSNSSLTNDTWSNSSITDGSWSNSSITDSSWSNSSVTGDIVKPDLNNEGIPSPTTAQGIGD